MALVLDTGVVLAALDAEDPDHDRCAELMGDADEQLLLPVPVLVELDYWIAKKASVEVWQAFCEDIDAGTYSLMHLDSHLLVAAAELQVRFADPRIGLVDAAVFSTCELIGEDKVATLDQRHFSVLRTTDGRSLRLLPR
ncbi:MAG: type II toxin-antitoxin system VapC family toxin [Actinomycetota bacterium]